MARAYMALALVAGFTLGGCGDSPSPVAPSSPSVASEQSTVTTVAAQPNSIYVSPDGRQPSLAVRTIARALRLVNAGDTVRILPGTYTEAVRLRVRGQPGRPIRIVGEGGRPVLSGGRRLGTGLWFDESAHLVLEHLEVQDYHNIGIAIVSSNNIQMRDMQLHDNGFRSTISWVEGYGVLMDESSDLVFENSDVFRNGPTPRTPTTVGTGIDCFAISRSVIRNNRSYDNNGGGILVEGNEVSANDLDVSADEWWDGGIWLDGGRDVVVRNNVFRDNLGPGIEISDEDLQQPRGYVLENNVSTGNYFGIYIWNFGTTDFPPRGVLRRSGNTFAGNSRRNVWIQRWPCPKGCD